MPVPFPLVTTFETAGIYKKWLWSNSAYITYTWHALLIWHTYLHTYIYIYIRTTSARICTPLIVSRSFHSLANNNTFQDNRDSRLFPKTTQIWYVHSGMIGNCILLNCVAITVYVCTDSFLEALDTRTRDCKIEC